MRRAAPWAPWTYSPPRGCRCCVLALRSAPLKCQTIPQRPLADPFPAPGVNDGLVKTAGVAGSVEMAG